MPFSKGVLVSSVMVTGIGPEAAYRLAEAIEEEFLAEETDAIGVEELSARVEEKLADQVGAGRAAAWTAWTAARRTAHPLLVLIGGATGTSKSTVATRLAGRLHISKVVSTADVRDVLRASLPEAIVPVIHASSFEADRKVQAPVAPDQDPVVSAFREQAEIVASGVRPIVERALDEGTDLIVEGTHLVPGIFGSDLDQWGRVAAVVQIVLTVTEPERHRAHFKTRLEHAKSRRPPAYLARFEGIRSIQRFILLQAEAHRIPVLETHDLDEVVSAASGLVMEALVGRHRSDLHLRGPSPTR